MQTIEERHVVCPSCIGEGIHWVERLRWNNDPVVEWAPCDTCWGEETILESDYIIYKLCGKLPSKNDEE